MEGDQENIFLESKSCESALTECLDSLQLSDKESGSKTFIAQPDPDTIKLFIGQIPKHLDEDQLEPIFASCGDICELVVIREKETNQHKGCAFLTYRTRAQAEEAIEAFNLKILETTQKTPLLVRPADCELDHKLFVGMVPKYAVEEDLEVLFQPFGEIESIQILRDRSTGESRGCGFVKFVERACALRAIEALDRQTIMVGSSNPLVVKFADKPKKSRSSKSVGTLSLIQNAHYLPQQYIEVVPNPYRQFLYPFSTSTPRYHSFPTQLNSLANMQYFNYGPASSTPMVFRSSQRQLEHSSTPTHSYSQGPPGANLFIYHLPHNFRDAELHQLFSPFGNILSCKVFIDKHTGESKGFGFVSYDAQEAAALAIQQMHGCPVSSKKLKVELKRQDRDQTLWDSEQYSSSNAVFSSNQVK